MYQVAVCGNIIQENPRIPGLTGQILDDQNIEAKVSTFRKSGELLASIQHGNPYDLYLIDLKLDRESGLELAYGLRKSGDSAPIILLSDTADAAIHGYRVKADDYLLKPLSEDSLRESVFRVFLARKTVLLRGLENSLFPIEPGSILWAEAFLHTTEIHMISGKIYSIRGILSEIFNSLNDRRFFRCHRSYFVNLDCVTEIGKSGLVLSDGTLIPIRRGSQQEIGEKLLRSRRPGSSGGPG